MKEDSNLAVTLSDCADNGIRLEAVGGDLRIYYEGEMPAPSLLSALKRYKRELLEYLTAAASTDEDVPRLASTALDRVPASPGQQRMWITSQLQKQWAPYNMVGAFAIKGALNVEALERSLDKLILRHDALRTVFVESDGELWQAVEAACLLDYARVDLSSYSSAKRKSHLLALLAEEGQWHFNLATGPLIRATTIDCAKDSFFFILNVHHIVCDGWSLGILGRELNVLYTAFSRGQEDPLPPLTIQYPDYATWQRQWLADDQMETQTRYWCEILAGAPVLLNLPSDRPRPAKQSFAGAAMPVEMDAELTARLKHLSEKRGTTLFMTLMAAWAIVLCRLSGQDDVVIGIPVANRKHREVEPLIGFFVNTVALRVDLSGEPNRAELLGRVRQAVLGAQDHQDLPFEEVVEIVKPPRSLDHTPLFQVMFAWQNNDYASLDLPDVQVEALDVPFNSVKFDLELILNEVNGTIAGVLNYATALFDAATIERHRDYRSGPRNSDTAISDSLAS